MGTFSEALEHLKANNFVKREVIKNDTVIVSYKNKLYQMSTNTGVRYRYSPTNNDLMSDDWIVVEIKKTENLDGVLKSKKSMETKSETPLMDLAPKMFTTIKSAQEALAKWIVPNSGITDSEVISELLGILDAQELVKKMREIEPIESDWEEILWQDSPNVEYTLFSEKQGIMEIKFKNGAIYQYLDFTKECWDMLSKAVSIGSFLHREVKGKFRYYRVNGD